MDEADEKSPCCKNILEIVEYNYSGCGVDMATCLKCGKGYEISYKVDKVTRCKSWDVELEGEA